MYNGIHIVDVKWLVSIPGCFSLTVNQRDNFKLGKFVFQQNSAFECAMACPSTSVGYIFLMVGFFSVYSH